MASESARAVKSTKPAARRAAARRPAARRTATSAPSAEPAAAAATAAAPATRIGHVQQLAERVVLIQVGAALEARDRVVGTVEGLVTTTRSRQALERRLQGFERRGGTARTELEREVRARRTRIERDTRRARRNVGHVVQNGVNAGIKLVSGAQERIGRV